MHSTAFGSCTAAGNIQTCLVCQMDALRGSAHLSLVASMAAKIHAAGLRSGSTLSTPMAAHLMFSPAMRGL